MYIYINTKTNTQTYKNNNIQTDNTQIPNFANYVHLHKHKNKHTDYINTQIHKNTKNNNKQTDNTKQSLKINKKLTNNVHT